MDAALTVRTPGAGKLVPFAVRRRGIRQTGDDLRIQSVERIVVVGHAQPVCNKSGIHVEAQLRAHEEAEVSARRELLVPVGRWCDRTVIIEVVTRYEIRD